jgi:hypothetical protein
MAGCEEAGKRKWKCQASWLCYEYQDEIPNLRDKTGKTKSERLTRLTRPNLKDKQTSRQDSQDGPREAFSHFCT